MQSKSTNVTKLQRNPFILRSTQKASAGKKVDAADGTRMHDLSTVLTNSMNCAHYFPIKG